MITTKAYITKVPEEGSNIFQVNIPLMQDNVSDEAIFDALLCSTSGNYNDYKVGDCVFVDFEDDKYNTAIIMGKLYTEVPKENEAYGLFNELKVTGSVTLPENTKIGQYSPQDIFNLYQGVQTLIEDQDDWVNETMLKERLKEYVDKENFNIFFGDEYFNEDYPYEMLHEFDNILEEGEDDEDKLWNENYNPDYTTLKNNWKTFIQNWLNKILGIDNDPVSDKPYSISQTLNKLDEPDSQTFDADNFAKGQSPVKESYFPSYSNLINNLKSLYTALVENFVRFEPNDKKSGGSGLISNKIRVMSGTYYQNISQKDNDTLYFLTDVPPNERT